MLYRTNIPKRYTVKIKRDHSGLIKALVISTVVSLATSFALNYLADKFFEVSPEEVENRIKETTKT